MPRVVMGPAVPDGKALDTEIARLHGLGVGELRAKWHTAFRRRAPPHLPRHLLFHILAYRLQADRLGELEADSRRLLDRIGSGSSGDHPIIQFAPKPAITLSRKDWHSFANRAVL